MCELFAMSSLQPANVTLSLDELSRHGGETGSSKDGWGVAFYEDNAARIIKEPGPASSSPLLDFIKSHPYHNRLIISHIRKATQGGIDYANTQPFSRELAGRQHVFAHNGSLSLARSGNGRFVPLGETDSECAFCLLMNVMAELWAEDTPPSLSKRLDAVSEFAARMRSRGPANFIYSDGEYLFCHGHERLQRDRGGIYPPGLHWLCRECTGERPGPALTGINMDMNAANQRVVLFASIPLTGENWRPFGSGQILVARDGLLLST